ncbi:MAG: polysaccharide pyruvyl transferase family protein [Candidatus Hodarchaeota archaeon]
MRIGIITHHWVYNFGANLQALSTYSFLSKMGHDVWLLNYRPQAKEDIYRQQVSAAQAATHEHFCDVYLRQSLLCRSEKQLVEFCREMHFDAIWVGSDAMFRLSEKFDREDTRFPNLYWLLWAKARLKPEPLTGSLAVSAMGTNYFRLPALVRRGISEAIQKMNHVSVRDRWTQLMLLAVSWGYCRPALCPDPAVVLNDVFEVPGQDAQEPAAKRGQYILLSAYNGMMSDEWIQGFVRIAHEQDLQVFSLPLPETELEIPVDRAIPLPISPLHWYAWIQYAAGFVGMRMHPVLCSMVNNVPFVSFDTYQGGRLRISSKTYDLCARAKTRSLCLSGQQRHVLSPRKAFEMLGDRKQKNAKDYVARAKSDFSRTISELLVC